MLIRIHIFDISSTQHLGMHLYNRGLWSLTELCSKQHNISKMYKKEDLIITNYKSVPYTDLLQTHHLFQGKHILLIQSKILTITTSKLLKLYKLSYCQKKGL